MESLNLPFDESRSVRLGISRSPAAAFILLCWCNLGREREAADLLRSNAPFADPNPRLIQAAAEALGRPQIATAFQTMGRPDRSQPRPFSVPSELALLQSDNTAIWGA